MKDPSVEIASEEEENEKEKKAGVDDSSPTYASGMTVEVDQSHDSSQEETKEEITSINDAMLDTQQVFQELLAGHDFEGRRSTMGSSFELSVSMITEEDDSDFDNSIRINEGDFTQRVGDGSARQGSSGRLMGSSSFNLCVPKIPEIDDDASSDGMGEVTESEVVAKTKVPRQGSEQTLHTSSFNLSVPRILKLEKSSRDESLDVNNAPDTLESE